MGDITLINNDCLKIVGELDYDILVTDPPFNIGYKYDNYKDKIDEGEYFEMLKKLMGDKPSVIIHYPEILHKLSIYLGKAPTKIVSWVYNSNTSKQHRQIAFYDIKPDFRKVGQRYKNETDKRIVERIKQGKFARLYDWWNINQVKNVSKEKTNHPCQMPLEVMTNIIGVLPDNLKILDPFMGSGTTGVACKVLNRSFIGIEQSQEYFKISETRIKG